MRQTNLLWGYEWQDSFVQEIDLPEGANELIYNSYEGRNYEIKLYIQELEIDAVKKTGWNPDAIKKLVLAHGHADHTGCCKRLAAQYGFAYSGTYQANALENGIKQAESTEMGYAVIKGEKWYYIMNETQLRAIGNTTDSFGKKNFLNNDITLTSPWKPIGTANAPFTGVFNGNGSAIIGLTMTEKNAEIIGLFGYANGAVFHNIELI